MPRLLSISRNKGKKFSLGEKYGEVAKNLNKESEKSPELK
ncbi:MAG: hypothetical protein ACJA0S_001374 [Rickettsiales bacterium]